MKSFFLYLFIFSPLFANSLPHLRKDFWKSLPCKKSIDSDISYFYSSNNKTVHFHSLFQPYKAFQLNISERIIDLKSDNNLLYVLSKKGIHVINPKSRKIDSTFSLPIFKFSKSLAINENRILITLGKKGAIIIDKNNFKIYHHYLAPKKDKIISQIINAIPYLDGFLLGVDNYQLNQDPKGKFGLKALISLDKNMKSVILRDIDPGLEGLAQNQLSLYLLYSPWIWELDRTSLKLKRKIKLKGSFAKGLFSDSLFLYTCSSQSSQGKYSKSHELIELL